MPNYLIRCYVTRTMIVEADDEEEAISNAPSAEDSEMWDTTSAEYEAEVSDEDEDLTL